MARKRKTATKKTAQKHKGRDSEYQLSEYLVCRVTPMLLQQLAQLAAYYSNREGSTITGPLLARRILTEVVQQRLGELKAGFMEEPEQSPLPLLPPSAAPDDDDAPGSYTLPLLDPKR